MQVAGRVVRVNDLNVVNDKFKNRTIHIETKDQYPQTIEVVFSQSKVDLLDSINVNDEVEIEFNLRGREWSNPKTGEIKVFNTLDGWKIKSDF
jgi:hypothetical protein